MGRWEAVSWKRMPDISFILQREAELWIELSAAAGRRFYFEGGGFTGVSGPSGTTAREDHVRQANKRPPPAGADHS